MLLPSQFRRISLLLWITFPLVLCSQSKKDIYQASNKIGTVHRWRHLGTWSSWSLWSECSRTCGGGVSIQTRECVGGSRHNGKHIRSRHHHSNTTRSHCVGVYRRYQLCNSKLCQDKHSADFRREQCSAFDMSQFAGKFYRWEPFFQVTHPCALNCRAVNFRFYATLARQVVDGTPCDEDAKPDRICVSGICQQIGCDGIIGSGKVYDNCGVCGGNNSTCRTITGLFMNPDLPDGYNHIASIPQGACNINITEMKQSKNYLALRQEGGDYIINGNWAINWPGDYPAVGTVFTYQRDDNNEKMSECITAKGPTKEQLDIMMIYKQQNPGIRYEYALPISDSPPPPRLLPPTVDSNPFSSDNLVRSHTAIMTPLSDTPTRIATYNGNKVTHTPYRTRKPDSRLKPRRHYAWQESGFSECSKSCAEGIRTALYVCVKIVSGIVVNDVHCESIPKPPARTEKCNTWACPPQWVAQDWSECSATCGHGVQTREMRCMQQLTPDLKVPVAESLCSTVQPSEHRRRACIVRSCGVWRTGGWSRCSAECGKGIHSRQVQCVGTDNIPLSEGHCDLVSRPPAEEVCDMGSCARTWFFTEWSTYQCAHKCGSGVQTRKIYCPVSKENECDPLQKPAETEACSGGSKCPALWFQGPWSQCSVSCGNGVQVRDILCVLPLRGQHRIVREVNCLESDKPPSKQPCSLTPCGSEWYMSDWTQCTKTCGTGVQTREVKCLDEHQNVSLSCTLNSRPITRQACAVEDCLHESQGDDGCRDTGNKCHIVAQARLCSYQYYRDACCQSCAKFTH